MTVHVEQDARGVMTVTLDRPDKRNAISEEMMLALVDALERAGADESAVRVVLLEGAGEHFCGGADIVARNRDNDTAPRPRAGGIQRRLPTQAHQLVALLCTIQVPVVCKVRGFAAGIGLSLALAACTTPPRSSPEDAKAQVFATERAFAKTMADRDYAAFTSFLAADAVFVSGPEPRRGKQAVADAWKRFFEKPQAPFSWEPERVEVLDSGDLALSTGPVRDPDGKLIATFTSIWRREAPGVWRIVFDRGNEACDCAKKP